MEAVIFHCEECGKEYDTTQSTAFSQDEYCSDICEDRWFSKWAR